jgi:predicted nucleotidyltransferase component of viral defense system
MSFQFLDRALAEEFPRLSVPLLDPREIAAEEIAAFWRRRKARDLYDLVHLGSILQAQFNERAISSLAMLKFYFDVVDEGISNPLASTQEVFSIAPRYVEGATDLGNLRAKTTDIPSLLSQCASRYGALA